MDKHYADTVRLLLTVAPDVFTGGAFALKGGTAINLFVRDMPRLSVDLDLVFTKWHSPRKDALAAISDELAAISERLRRRRLTVRTSGGGEFAESKLLIDDGVSLVKVEVNPVFRGTVLDVESRPLATSTSHLFSVGLQLPVLAVDELSGGKILAALDRQHPRDLFDIAQLYEAGGITDGMIECAVTYLAGHSRPIHEVLFPSPKDVAQEYHATFVGMTRDPVALETLLDARTRLLSELPRRLTDEHRRFLAGMARAEPDWSLLKCSHAASLPAIQWKLINLEKFKKLRPAQFAAHVETLEQHLEQTW